MQTVVPFAACLTGHGSWWGVDISETAFRERLRHQEPRVRAQWMGGLMREARVREVWAYVTLTEVLEDWENLQRHLGRRRAFWE